MRFDKVWKTFGKHSVLRGLDLSIEPGHVTFIIGRSGEGKSVTIKHIAGILTPDSGTIEFDGRDMTHATWVEWQKARRKMGILFQDGALFDSISVAENVSFALDEFSGWSSGQVARRVDELLELVGLPGRGKLFPTELSIGEKKRVGLARALALEPKVLLYDEPTTGMDAFVSERIDELIGSLQRSHPHMASVVVSHDLRSIATTAQRILFLHEGIIHFDGSVEDFNTTTDGVVSQFREGSPMGPLAKPIG